jgi:hypothetical protein
VVGLGINVREVALLAAIALPCVREHGTGRPPPAPAPGMKVAKFSKKQKGKN